MKGRHLLLMASLGFGGLLGALIAGAPWDTPNEPVRVVEIDPTTTTMPKPTTTTSVKSSRTTTTSVKSSPTTTTSTRSDPEASTEPTDTP